MSEEDWLEKIHYQDDHPEVIKEAGYYTQFIDGNAAMTKSASDAFSRSEVDKWKPDDRHFGIHLIAMGSEESVGPNRNGDSWPSAALEAYHPTFVTNGCYFREHKNRCQKTQGIGTIKAAAYNKPMQRVELIVWGDKRKAEEEYEMAKAGKELSFSMSARMPFDRCSICDKKSRRQADYCDDLKNHMLQYVPKMKKYAFARNMDNLKFFDISRVGKRADRVATYIRYMFGDDLTKAASFNDSIITGAQWAEMEFEGRRGLGVKAMREFSPWEQQTLEKLAAAEQELRESNQPHLDIIRAGGPRGVPQHILLQFAERDIPSLAGELAKKGMVLDFVSFASMVSGKSAEELHDDKAFRKVAATSLPGIFGRMLMIGGCDCGGAAEMVAPDEFGCALSGEKDMIDNLIKEVGDNLGMENDKILLRAFECGSKQAKAVDTPTTEGDAGFFQGLLKAYGYYAVKAAHIAQHAKGVVADVALYATAAMNRNLM